MITQRIQGFGKFTFPAHIKKLIPQRRKLIVKLEDGQVRYIVKAGKRYVIQTSNWEGR